MALTRFLRDNAPWLAAGGLLTFLSSFGQTFFISIFAGEIRTEFGLSHGAWGGLYSLGTTASAVVMIWAGALTDRYRVRALGGAALAGLALACLSMAVVSSVWLLPLVVFALRFAGQGMASHVAVVAMARWFVATRGRALAIATLGFSVGEALLPLFFVALMVVVDWRYLWGLAALIALAGWPLLLRLLRTERQPQSLADGSDCLGMNGRHWTRRACLSHPLFWFMVPALLGPSAFNTAFFFHQVHYADIKGWSHVELVAMFPVYTGLAIVAMIGSGWALDRWGTARLMPFYQLPLVIGFVMFSTATGLWAALLGFACLAITTGANSTLANAFWAEFYGTRHLGAIKALAAAMMVLGSAIGPGLTGGLIDAGMPLERQFLWVAVYFLLATALMWAGIARARSGLPARQAI